jgi:mono/diheme cytochrome c family protein
VRRLTAFIVAAAIAVGYVTAVQSSQESKSQGVPESKSPTVWDGIYTEAQAYRGEKVADTTCIGCHGPKLDGGDSGPILVGERFLSGWTSQSVGELFAWMQEAMPAEAPGTLSKNDTAAVLAYILKLNKIPAGKVELSTDRAVLDRIRFTEAPAR